MIINLLAALAVSASAAAPRSVPRLAPTAPALSAPACVAPAAGAAALSPALRSAPALSPAALAPALAAASKPDAKPAAAPALAAARAPAASAPERTPAEEAAARAQGLKKYMCLICGFVYDEAKGLPDEGIAPGTRWSDIPEDWKCPECGESKASFDMAEMP